MIGCSEPTERLNSSLNGIMEEKGFKEKCDELFKFVLEKALTTYIKLRYYRQG